MRPGHRACGLIGAAARGARVAAMAGLAIGALTGCGSSSASSTSSAAPATVNTPPAALRAVRGWQRAVNSGNCPGLVRVALPGLTAARCRALMRAYAGPEVERVAAYGRAAVADIVLLTAGTRAAAVFIDTHGLGWRFANMLFTGHAVVGTAPTTLAAGAAMLERVLPAIARGSCTAVAQDFLASTLKSAHAPGPNAPGLPNPANCYHRNGSGLQRQLRLGGAMVSPIGGNSRLAFYRVATGRGHGVQFLFSVVTGGGRPLLFSEYPLAVGGATAGRAKPRMRHSGHAAGRHVSGGSDTHASS